ncbi:MAG: hypothetical protein PHN92_09750 [Geobacter sp.]|nr:hypothetical protein [Geobacter sp.]
MKKKPEPMDLHAVTRLRTVDTSYRERRRIIRLLDFLTRDQLTRDQLERIGRRLQKSGRRALPPLVRRIWREQDHERLYRYTCMLDFFDATSWLDQLVALTLKRRDLADEGRLPLLEILQDYGVDVSSPPFSRDELTGATLNSFLDLCLQEGSWGMVRFMDRFLNADEMLRDQLIRRLGNRADQGTAAAAFLRMLAYFEYSEVAGLAVESLGTLRHSCAVEVLQSLENLTVEGLEEQIGRSLRRLSFLGINQPEPLPASLAEPVTVITVQATPLDCYGVRAVWFSWEMSDGTLAGLVLQLGEDDGVRHTVASRFQNRREHDEYLEEINAEEGLYAVGFDYAVNLLRDALLQSTERSFYLPPDLYACRYLFGKTDLRPADYIPGFPVELLDGLIDRMASLLSGCEELLDEPFFEGWLFTDPLIYELAEGCGAIPLGSCSEEAQQLVIERFCGELIEPDKPALLRRLLLTADFMVQTDCSKRSVQMVLALGLSLAGSALPLSRHPFIRRLGFDSVEMARQALAEGVDPRKNQVNNDDEEWE